jgi:hypothetical protein
MNTAIAAQLVALLIGCATVAWGAMSVLAVLFPGSSGEWGGLPVYFSVLLNAPLGVALLIFSRAFKKGSPLLRTICSVLAIIALALPVLAHMLWRLRLRF